MMEAKRVWSLLLALMLAVSCTVAPVSAAYTEDSTVITRAAGRLDHSIPANTLQPIGSTFSLDAKDKISYDCTYSPASASMDFGVIAPDGRFYFINSTDGSIDVSITVSQRGEYQLAIRNNESYAVTVTGTVKY